MSLLGIDVGTTGCKAAAFSEEGDLIALAYQEYDVRRPEPSWAELDATELWERVKRTIKEVALQCEADPIRALAVSSFGEAIVPVTADREILGPALLNFDERGAEYLPDLATALEPEHLYQVTGNVLGNHYSLTKLMWIKEHRPALYERAFKLLLVGSFVSFMLGAEPVADYSLANRTLLFDIEYETWSDEMLTLAGLERGKLADVAPSGVTIGRVSDRVASELGLSPRIIVVNGAHDQCANALGCGVVADGQAVYGMGTYTCITPAYSQRCEATVMMEQGLNTEHHVLPGRYVSFVYNQGGALVKWYRDTFAAAEARWAREEGRDVYDDLMAEMPQRPSSVAVLPHFTTTGPPDYISDSCGVIVGLRLDTTRGDILRGIVEGSTFYLKQCMDSLPATGVEVSEYRAVGGGSRSDAWIQICADILGRPFIRPRITEAGALGAAIIAGLGAGHFDTFDAAIQAMVAVDRAFEPDLRWRQLYDDSFARYAQLWPLMAGYLQSFTPA